MVDLLRADKRLVQIERQPGIFSVDIAADGVSMIRRHIAMLLDEPCRFGHAVGKQRLNLAPVAALGATMVERSMMFDSREKARVTEATSISWLTSIDACFVRGNLVEGDSLGAG